MILTIIVLIFLMAPISLFVHELGHVLPGLFFGSERSNIHIGRGSSLLHCRGKKLELSIHVWFFQGAYSINERSPAFSNFEKVWISIGGPLLNGLFALILSLFFSEAENPFVKVFLLFNLYLAIVNLIPFSFKGKGSDGYHVWQLLKRIWKRVE
ncbi:site-2 protease family protein [Halobacillus dabanensis]|uniref:site-2 protease family protein n=1 Tax=Halobacillus dabanensis TaxID=240302 RepID=UPI000944BA1B|nr:site-2 protease family protein [Halobacillus dabanensis]